MTSSPNLTAPVNSWAESDTISGDHPNIRVIKYAVGAGSSSIRSANFQLRYLLLNLGADMRRREFLGSFALSGFAVLAGAETMSGQQADRTRRIGVLLSATQTD